MAEELNRFGVEALAWCLMRNRTHLIVVPKDSAALARAIGEAHRRYTRMKNSSDGVRGKGDDDPRIHTTLLRGFVRVGPRAASSLSKRLNG